MFWSKRRSGPHIHEDGEGSGEEDVWGAAEVPWFVQPRVEELRGALMAAYSSLQSGPAWGWTHWSLLGSFQWRIFYSSVLTLAWAPAQGWPSLPAVLRFTIRAVAHGYNHNGKKKLFTALGKLVGDWWMRRTRWKLDTSVYFSCIPPPCFSFLSDVSDWYLIVL